VLHVCIIATTSHVKNNAVKMG